MLKIYFHARLGIAFALYTFAMKGDFSKYPHMIRRILLLCLSFTAFLPQATPQKLKKSDRILMDNLEQEIGYLASDKLEGRRTGTPGEKLASDYIIASFQKTGLQPMGDHGGWLQTFEIYEGKQIDSTTYFRVNGKALQVDNEFFPLQWSAQQSVEGSPAIALQERGVPWFIDLKETVEASQGNPHFDLQSLMQDKVRESAKKGASAVVFYNSSRMPDNLAFEPKAKYATADIPALYITKEAKRKYFKDESASLDLRINVRLYEKTRQGHNVIGFLNNGASYTVVVGAHYDHIGYGEDGNSLYQGKDREIHNGADDNASGTAAMLELARLLKQSRLRKNNYLFIAFSGEELGLYGSKYFTDHPTVDLNSVNYMLNMDMVGRLNDSTHALTVGGYGTSPSWGELFRKENSKKYFTFRFDSSGTGPSDYTSFYRKGIPVLFFFTGLHEDYHRPTDDANKINYPGEVQVVRLIETILDDLNDKGKLAFEKTREFQPSGAPKFTVTLGIMPDYTFSGSGVRVDGVSEGRPAFNAGLRVGDIIVMLGDFQVTSLDNYMQALSNFKKGDKTTVRYKRGDSSEEAHIQF